MTNYNLAALSEYTLPNACDSRLPTLYIVEDHPLHPSTHPGRSFVVAVRPTIEAMEEAEQFEKSLEIPRGQKEELDAQGLLELEPGDYLYGRNELGSGRPEDDVLFAWSVGEGSLTADAKSALDTATRNALGGRAGRTRSSVRMECYFKPVKADTRCYGVASSLERQPTIVAPTAQLKDPRNSEEVRDIASGLASAVAPIAMHSMHQAPTSVQGAIRRRSEMLGLPRLGSNANWAFQALQVNVASVPEDRSGDLSQQMGFFGQAHFDEGDSAGHYTNMITNSDLPDGYDAGYFHLLAFGVYVRLRNYCSFNFQGNRRHGGSGPFPPPGETPPPHAYRFNLVSYPPANMMNPTQTRWRVATNPGIPAYVTPEMRDPEYHPPCSSTTGNESATFFKHGYVYMDRQSQAEFYSRALYDMCRYYANQVPTDTRFTINPDTLLQAFSYRGEDGVDRTVPRWEMAPRVEVDEPATTEVKEHYAKTRRMWEEDYKKTAGMIPSRFLRSAKLRAAMGCTEVDCESDATTTPPKPTKSCKRKAPDDKASAAKKQKTVQVPRIVVPASETENQGESSQQGLRNSASKGTKTKMTPGAKTSKKGGRSKGKGKADASREEKEENQFSFARETTAALLENELYQFMREIKAAGEMERQQDLSTVTALVSETVDAVGGHPQAPTSGQDVGTIVDNIVNIEAIIGSNGYDVRLGWVAATTGRSAVWQWLTKDVKTMARQELDRRPEQPEQTPWISRLVSKARGVLQGRLESSTFDSGEHHFHGVDGGVSYLFVNAKSKRKLAGNELKDAVCDAVSDIVSGWLQYSKEANMKLEWFLSALREALGEEIMSMDHTWRLVTNFRSTYVSSGSHPNRTADPNLTIAFKEEVARHPILQENTREHEIYTQYQRLYRGEISTSEVTIAFGTGPGWAKYVAMWRTALQYVNSPTSEPETKFHQLLINDADFYLPVREKAPCRTRSTQADGPYQENTIKTLPGIFSVLVFRCITYRSPFFFNHKPLYQDWQDFSDRIDNILGTPGFEGMKWDNTYFSLLGPYGRPNPQRSVELAERYYKTISERRWTHFCGRRRTFSETMKYFAPTNIKKNIYPQLGDLARMGLVCDLAYASVCEMPTLGDMAECVVTMGSGALKGLQILRVIDEFPKKTTKTRKIKLVEDALQQVMDFMEGKFSKVEQQEMGLDLIVLEHSLCKLSRAEKEL